jgi:microcystin-dependent protein
MVGLNGSDTLFDTLEETGGSKDATVVSHTHTATSTVTDPGHIHTLTGRTHSASSGNATEFGDGVSSGFSNTDSVQNATTGITVATTVSSAGSSGTDANLQPYITVAMWKRTA